MTAVAFDTLQVARELSGAGMEPRTAEGVATTFARVWSDREQGLATKADLALLESRLDAKFDALRSEFRQALLDQAKWLVGSQVAIGALVVALIKLT